MSYKLSTEENNGKGIFILEKEGKQAARVEFRREGDSVLIVEYTEVMPEYRGTEAGRKAVEKVVEKAREENLELKSECSYFSHQMKRQQKG